LSNRQARENPEYILNEGELLLTTDGTVGRVYPVTKKLHGWFGSNNMARINDGRTDMGFLYTFLSTPYGLHQICKDIYGGVVDHINESHICPILIPEMPSDHQKEIGDLVRSAFSKKDRASELEDLAIDTVERLIKEDI